MRIAILGFAREGQSLLAFLKKSAQYKNAEFWIVDKKATTKIPPGVHGQLGKNYLQNLEKFGLVFRSPGVPYNLPELKKARRAGVVFSSATKLFFENCPATIIGVTGTKGKSTTSTLIYRVLKAAKKKAVLAGNIGSSALDSLPTISKKTYVVLELSSFQLQDLQTSPQIAVVLDVFPDHQDSHLNLNEYYDAKANIARYQKKGGEIFFFKHSPKSRWIAQKSRGKKIAVDEKRFELFGEKDLKLRGGHSFRNAVMAATVALNLGIPRKTVIRVIKNFRGLEHRLELVRTIRVMTPAQRKAKMVYSGILKNLRIDFYNDSASTNPHTTAAAIQAFNDKRQVTSNKRGAKNHPLTHVACHMSLILIAGGQDKNLDYKPLAEALKNSDTKLAVLYGENKKKIAGAISRIKNPGLRIMLVGNLKSAVTTAYTFAKKSIIHNSSFVILFSPGAASFDQFKNYADRGTQFKKFVKKLK
ncbi:MAG: UDP-N-acetylmuramoyl-L-alanine--D-glutamate ligase [Candidatus Liptonbacteria bacterium]|nr:UDP-N-acetylmuramoyl-L-alanine--D-glutamate ligase [Candidatus Liptonbacteria bacterium]